ncbi:hypothetical protein SMICM17S_11653 [Streptomyces microflavus]
MDLSPPPPDPAWAGFSATVSGVPSPARTPSMTWRASLSLRSPGDQRGHPGDLRRGDRQLVQASAGLVGVAGQLAHPPLAGGGRGCARVGRGDDQVERAGVEDRLHVVLGDAPVLLEPGAAQPGQFGQALAELLDPVAGRCHGHQVRLGEVAVVLGVVLDTAGRGGAGLLVEMPGLLHDGAARGQHGGVPLDLVARGALDGTQRVHVLRLGAGTELLAAVRAQRQVDVAAHLAHLHARLGDPEGLDQLAQLGDVRLGDLGGAGAAPSIGLVTISMSGMPARL